MTLSKYELSASIAVSDMARARVFYEGRLGLSTADDRSRRQPVYSSGGDTARCTCIRLPPTPADRLRRWPPGTSTMSSGWWTNSTRTA